MKFLVLTVFSIATPLVTSMVTSNSMPPIYDPDREQTGVKVGNYNDIKYWDRKPQLDGTSNNKRSPPSPPPQLSDSWSGITAAQIA
ncbi:hypothetical protein N7456_010342 [Penicillium angulare]|uniref:Uncharacterized protein n=1 Tax=Penicillium angulare TaxID=116970 RepID=A0A9W9F6M3_9EURO|nr:hypothetical protein N7456_010342 [Penicillium angulare]